MHNETSAEYDIHDKPDEILEGEVCEAAERDEDVEESVHRLTFAALSMQPLDRESLRRIINAVVEGARRGVQQEAEMTAEQLQTAQARLHQAISGLDAALAQCAQAAKLTVEEAVGRAQAFGEDDLAKVRADLSSLESMFLETLKTSAQATRGFVSDTLHKIVSHAERNGTAVGTELKETLAAFAQHMARGSISQVETGLQLAQATAGLMRNIAAGVFSGVADRLKTIHPRADRER